MMRAAVITISDKGYQGVRKDASGPLLAEQLGRIAEVVERVLVADEPAMISEALIRLAEQVDLVITTGGTGLAPRDQTPEATLAVIDRPVPGISELLRAQGTLKTPMASLSRGVAGLRGRCLIINLPGSLRAVAEGMETLLPILPHAVQMAQGIDLEHHQQEGDVAHP
ncbi:MAG: MogA/MoaB family molybdenum cofactor biosynthesis protein [Chloroflexi bacterium]|nr:MogA/MoaB family molybdenum cofactor biosynthesis protein [Chloroflexota bacterium]